MDTVEEIYDFLMKEIAYVRRASRSYQDKSAIDKISKKCHEMLVMCLNQRDDIANLNDRIELLVNCDAER